MKVKSYIAIIGLLSAVTLAGYTWKKFGARVTAEKSLARISAAITAERLAIDRVEVELVQSEKETAGLPTVLDSLRRAAQQASLSETPSGKVRPSRAPNVLQLLQTDPELQLRQIAAERARLTARFGPLYRALNLPAGKIDKFEEIAIRHKEQQMDLFAVMQAQKISNPMADPAISKLFQEEETTYAAAQTELLGAEGHAQLNEYERTSTVRDLVSGLAGAVTLAGEPFSTNQAEQLTQILANACPSYIKGGWATPSEIDWAKVDSNAHTILSKSSGLDPNIGAQWPGRNGRALPRAT
jgi:hypothetical protein